MSISDDASTIPLIRTGARAAGTPYSEEYRGGPTKSEVVVDRVPIAKLQQQIEKLCSLVQGEALTASKPGNFAADEVKIIAEVTASGEIGFLVAGMEVEAKGSIEITFRRSRG